MTGNDFITLAGKLAASANWGCDEARHRTAVSRAYYGAFHAVCLMLRDWGFMVRRNSYGHQDAYDILWQSGHPLAQSVAVPLDDLRSLRICADYRTEDRQFATPAVAKLYVETATTLLSQLDRCRAASDEIKAAIVASQST